jgi:transposase
MKRKRKQYSGAFKARIGLEAMIGIKTTAQIARENQVHPLLVGQWKSIVRERLPELFERGHPVPEDSEKLIAQLHQKIGQLTVDLDWLKKKSKQLGLSLRDEN